MKFLPNIHTALWGHEEWLVSGHPSSPSIIAEGDSAGEPFDRYWKHLTGEAFPLLVKIIDARDALSLQVHPNEKTALLTGGEPKTEMWHILEAAPGSAIWAGIKPGTTAQMLEDAIKDGSLADLLVKHAVHPGETYFIPGGTVHAIGAGVKIFEVQQSSNTTYRLYDWNRKNPDGTSRELHIEKGLLSIDYALPAPADCGNALDCEFFRFRRTPDSSITVSPGGEARWEIVYAGGECNLVMK